MHLTQLIGIGGKGGTEGLSSKFSLSSHRTPLAILALAPKMLHDRWQARNHAEYFKERVSLHLASGCERSRLQSGKKKEHKD